MKQIKTVLTGLFLFLSVTGVASAANVFGEDVQIDASPVLLMAQVIIVALVAIWPIKKVIALSNKS